LQDLWSEYLFGQQTRLSLEFFVINHNKEMKKTFSLLGVLLVIVKIGETRNQVNEH